MSSNDLCVEEDCGSLQMLPVGDMAAFGGCNVWQVGGGGGNRRGSVSP